MKSINARSAAMVLCVCVCGEAAHAHANNNRKRCCALGDALPIVYRSIEIVRRHVKCSSSSCLARASRRDVPSLGKAAKRNVHFPFTSIAFRWQLNYCSSDAVCRLLSPAISHLANFNFKVHIANTYESPGSCSCTHRHSIASRIAVNLCFVRDDFRRPVVRSPHALCPLG